MAFGLSPKYVQDFSLDALDKQHFLVLATEAAVKLGWSVSFASATGFIAYTKFSWSSWGEEVTVKVDNGSASIKSACTGSQLFDWGRNKKNVEALLSAIREQQMVLKPEAIEEKIAALQQSYPPSQEDILSKPPSTTKEKITNVLSIFIPTKGYFVSPILININILIFIAMVVSGVHIFLPENQSLIDWGANFRPVTLEGAWWRLLTACFLHIGILHLLLNMYALLYIGLLLEPYLGKTRFLAAYVISGIAASITSLWWHELTISAGASGAIFGMYGVFLALLTTNLLDKSVRNALFTSIAIFVGYNILNGLRPNSGIDNAAHIGGLISGLVIGYAFVPSLKKYKNKVLAGATVSALSVILFAFAFFIYKTLPNDIGKYSKEMERFVAIETKALEVYNLPPGTANEKILSELKDNGLRYWHENLILVEGLTNLDLPLEIRVKNSMLKEYCELRIKSYQLIYKSIREDTDKYQDNIDSCNHQIETLIKQLSEKN